MFSAAGVVLLFRVETGEVMLKDCCAFICVESVWEIDCPLLSQGLPQCSADYC